MELTQLAISMIKNNPKWVKKIESISGQPVDYTFKCMNDFIEQLQRGPGIKSQTDKLTIFKSNYELVMGLGCFRDYEAQILAADISGFSLAEVVQHFRMNLKWDTNVDEISEIHKQLLPRFREVAKRVGLIKETEETEMDKSVPNFGGKCDSKNGEMVEPPWKQDFTQSTNFKTVSS